MKQYGRKVWLIADNYLNSVSLNDWQSHEAVCVLNTGNADARIKMTLYFEDRECRDDFVSVCPARKTHHIRLDKIRSTSGELIPRDMPYAMLIESSVPVVVQYSRLDTSHKEMALMTTVAYPVDEGEI